MAYDKRQYPEAVRAEIDQLQSKIDALKSSYGTSLIDVSKCQEISNLLDDVCTDDIKVRVRWLSKCIIPNLYSKERPVSWRTPNVMNKVPRPDNELSDKEFFAAKSCASEILGIIEKYAKELREDAE